MTVIKINSDKASGAQKRQTNLVIVVLLCVTTVPLAIWAGLCAYKVATEPLDNPWLLALFVPAALAFVTMWSSALYKSVVTR